MCCWPRSSRSTRSRAVASCSPIPFAPSCAATPPRIAVRSGRWSTSTSRRCKCDSWWLVVGSWWQVKPLLRPSATNHHLMFHHGCNYPWSTDGSVIYYGLDFGANVWGSHLGVSTRRDAVARDFLEMAALGFTVVRWFVFGDGRAGIVFDERGFPSGTDPHFFVDLDTALEVARDAGIALNLVLLDHRWMFEGVRETIADPATGALLEARLPPGRARVLHAPAGRAALVDSVIEPMVRRS